MNSPGRSRNPALRKYLKYGQHFLYRGVCGSVTDDNEKLERASPTTAVLLMVSS